MKSIEETRAALSRACHACDKAHEKYGYATHESDLDEIFAWIAQANHHLAEAAARLVHQKRNPEP